MIPRRRIPLRAGDLWAGAASLWPTPVPPSGTGVVADFEAAFAKYFGVTHALATASGRDALLLILDALQLAPGDEVIIPAYTLGELLPLMLARGLQLVPADIDPTTFNITPASVAGCLTPRTRAILAVHLLGAPCAIGEIVALGAARGIPVIEDCAHAPGARVGGRPVGSFGRAALFSLEATKAVSAYGGGVLATNDAALAAHARAALAGRVPSHGALRKAAFKWLEECGVRSPLYGPLARLLFAERNAGRFEAFYRRAHSRLRGEAAAPAAFGAFQARLALRGLGELDARHARLNACWDELAARLPDRFRRQRRDAEGEPAFYNFVARFSGDVRALRRAAHRRGLDLAIGSEVMDDTARLLGREDCPGAAAVSADAVLIPLYDGIGRRRFETMVSTLHALARELP